MTSPINLKGNMPALRYDGDDVLTEGSANLAIEADEGVRFALMRHDMAPVG
jgi:hypothetical protein